MFKRFPGSDQVLCRALKDQLVVLLDHEISVKSDERLAIPDDR